MNISGDNAKTPTMITSTTLKMPMAPYTGPTIVLTPDDGRVGNQVFIIAAI